MNFVEEFVRCGNGHGAYDSLAADHDHHQLFICDYASIAQVDLGQFKMISPALKVYSFVLANDQESRPK
ncbi:hypothetical protein NECAME_09074 [Necator americanus]|uniref:Uncharacterized protein n=1 Tax=Necator americanus TaxID=51031 RepID=W2TG26_NECAM|nr:hypothetical protein NECAME_09074 [Necator americanus]ETN80554.1 hypothetical protein NECAME_09074 [Necator americanus]